MDAPLTPVDTTSVVRRPNQRGHHETAEARSTDGEWAYERGEEPGTPWHIHHLTEPKGVVENAAGTYRGARWLTANKRSWLLAQIERRAHLVHTTNGAAAWPST